MTQRLDLGLAQRPSLSTPAAEKCLDRRSICPRGEQRLQLASEFVNASPIPPASRAPRQPMLAEKTRFPPNARMSPAVCAKARYLATRKDGMSKLVFPVWGSYA